WYVAQSRWSSKRIAACGSVPTARPSGVTTVASVDGYTGAGCACWVRDFASTGLDTTAATSATVRRTFRFDFMFNLVSLPRTDVQMTEVAITFKPPGHHGFVSKNISVIGI